MNFKMNVSQFRRKRLLESIMSGDKNKKERGAKIMQNFKKQVIANNNLKDILTESKKSGIFVNGFDVRCRKTQKWCIVILPEIKSFYKFELIKRSYKLISHFIPFLLW